MRIKLSLIKAHGGRDADLIPLHHQRILSSFLEEIIQQLPASSPSYCFSSLKGTSKVMNGQIRFLSTKISLVITSPEKEFTEQLLKKIFEIGKIELSKLTLIPKSYQLISEPQFQTVMRYICISPIIPCPPFTDETSNPLDPTSHEFSDCIYDALISSMEKAGYSEIQLHDFAEFEITPDASYMQKIQNNPKKYARVYRNKNNEATYGYLFPFTIHAHPEVQKFIWERGLGLHTIEGYGMLDTVPEAPVASEHITP
jgi:CRISPR-associated endoribonuclease Cas6